MSCKAIILLYRSADSTHEEFAAWWLSEHAPLAATLPGLRRAVFNVVDEPADDDPDGVSELWFDSRDDFAAAYATAIGQAVVADTMAHVSQRRRVLVDERQVVG
jgi:uncharacterized protein (TIGR02118 family)